MGKIHGELGADKGERLKTRGGRKAKKIVSKKRNTPKEDTNSPVSENKKNSRKNPKGKEKSGTDGKGWEDDCSRGGIESEQIGDEKGGKKA